MDELIEKYQDKTERVESKRVGLAHQNELTSLRNAQLDTEKSLLNEVVKDLKTLRDTVPMG